MANPYKSPVPNEGDVQSNTSSPFWLICITWIGALAFCVFVSVVLGAKSFHFDELNGWVILVFATLLFLFATSATFFRTEFTASTNFYLCRTLAFASFAFTVSYAITGLSAFARGIPAERWVFLNRAFGEFAWVYWGFVASLGLIPLTLWFVRWHSNRNLVWAITLATTLFSAIFVHGSFIINHSVEMPTSWHQFFWPFAAMIA